MIIYNKPLLYFNCIKYKEIASNHKQDLTIPYRFLNFYLVTIVMFTYCFHVLLLYFSNITRSMMFTANDNKCSHQLNETKWNSNNKQQLFFKASSPTFFFFNFVESMMHTIFQQYYLKAVRLNRRNLFELVYERIN